VSSEVAHDTHYEAVLDEEPSRKPVYVDVVARQHELRPIIPASVRGWSNIKGTLRRFVGLNLHRAGYHGWRLPLVYVPLACMWAIVGLFKIAGKQIYWWWLLEQHGLRQHTATQNDYFGWSKLHKEAKTTRLTRGIWLGLELGAVLAVVVTLLVLDLWWAWALFAAATVPLLAHHGRPADRPIVNPAVVTPRFRTINADVVLRAYYAAGLGKPDKDDQRIGFGSRMERDGDGGRVLVDLPYGKTFDDAVKARGAIASGLDVSVNQVFLTRDKSSVRRHMLYVSDVDPLAIPAGRTPLLTCKTTDIWRPAPLGLDERGRRVNVALMWIAILIGAQPRKGKTFTARQLALYAALDPYVRITIADGKNSPDWKPFRLVAHRIIMGFVPNSFSPDPVEELLLALREIKRHIETVNDFLSKLPITECPEGKLTRELSRKYPQLRVWLLVMEEFHYYFELDNQDTNKEIAALLSYIMATGPSAGVILLSATQKPAGVGAGDVQRLFNRYRDNHSVRFALRCGSRDVSIAVLGGDAYQEGFDASALPNDEEYRGVGYLYGAADQTPTVRTFLATGEDAQKILLAARHHREQAQTLTGAAAGEDVSRDLRDVLRDVDSVFYAGEAWISWPQLAQRLATQYPEHYADLTADAISAQVRSLGVAAKKGRDRYDDNRSVQGVPQVHVAETLRLRELEAKR